MSTPLKKNGASNSTEVHPPTECCPQRLETLVDDAENLKIADVGIAKALCDEQGTSVQEYMETVAGTPLCMAPEVWEGHYARSSDVFSLGLGPGDVCDL